MWAGVGERRQEQGPVGATGAGAGPARARPPRHQKSADLDVLSGTSSDESSATEEEGSSSTQMFSLRHIPAFVGSSAGASGDEEEWEGHAKHIRSKRAPAKPLKPPTPPQDGGGGTSNPSPQSTDTARISSSSFGTIVAGGSEGGRDSRSGSASQDQAATPLTNWVDNSGWELAGEGTGTTRERQALRAEQRRRQERIREEAAVAAAAEVAAAGGDVNAVAAAAVAAAAAAADREGFGRSGPRARRQQQQQQPRPSQPPRQPGKLRVRGSHRRGGGGGGGGGGDNDGDDGDVEDGGAMAVAADGQRVRLSTNDFKTPVRRPLPGTFAAEAAAAAAPPAAGPGGGCQLCAPSGKSGGALPLPEAAAGARTCGCSEPAKIKPADMFAQTSEMELHPPVTGARGLSAGARPREAEGTSFGASQLARGDGGDEVKEEEGELPSSAHSFIHSKSSNSSKGRGRGIGGLLGKHSGSDTIDSSVRSSSLGLAADEAEVRRAESLVEVIGHHPELEGSHRELVDTFRTTSLRDTGSSMRATSRMTSLRDTGSSTGSVGSRRRDSGGSERRRRRGLLGGLKKGMGVVWEKIAADHPEPLPIDKTLSKEEQKAKHLQMEIRRRNDWQTNSMAEQHVLRCVMMEEEEKVV